MISSEAMRRWPDCASDCVCADLRLMLDFVGPTIPRRIIRGLRNIPSITSAGPKRTWSARRRNYTRVKRKGGDLVLAHGRDPYFPGWSDTLQLNYANAATQRQWRANF